MSTTPEPYDLGDALGDFGALVTPCEAIPPGELWTGPTGSDLDDAIRMFGPGTTAGGRAEAGWVMLGTIADDGLVFTPHRDQLAFGDPRRLPGER